MEGGGTFSSKLCHQLLWTGERYIVDCSKKNKDFSLGLQGILFSYTGTNEIRGGGGGQYKVANMRKTSFVKRSNLRDRRNAFDNVGLT